MESGVIKTLFTSVEKDEALFPRTKTRAVSDDNGVGLDALLSQINTELNGKAPDGFGLGYDCQPINSWDDAITTGFYKSNGNTPEGFWWWGYAISHDKNNVVQTIYREDNYGNLVGCQRKSSDGEWLEWEYVNSPMQLGVEYRTTERYHGLPVYVKTIAGMALPGNGTTSIEHGIEGWYRTLRYAINTENTFRIFAAYSGITDIQVSDKTISITTVNNASTDANVEITLWYLKL